MGKNSTNAHNFFRHHSLSIAAIGILVLWIGLYSVSNPRNHLGSFFGNAIADWTGVVVTVLATKFMYERGSAESRRPPRTANPAWQRLRDHSLTIFLLVTGMGWVILFISMDSEGKWGQVVGNIVSEWTQIFGLLLLTKNGWWNRTLKRAGDELAARTSPKRQTYRILESRVPASFIFRSSALRY